MKKNIEFVNIDSSLLGWIIDEISKAPDYLKNTGDLLSALDNLKSSKTSSLVLEAGEKTENTSLDNCISCGDLLINLNSRKVTRGGTDISLTPKEFEILYFLAENKGTVFTKEQIYKAVWDDNYLLDDSNIMAFIRKLRKKIEPDPDSPRYIITMWGIGYMFNDKI